MTEFTAFQFLHPGLLLLLPALWLLIRIYSRHSRRPSMWSRICEPKLLHKMHAEKPGRDSSRWLIGIMVAGLIDAPRIIKNDLISSQFTTGATRVIVRGLQPFKTDTGDFAILLCFRPVRLQLQSLLETGNGFVVTAQHDQGIAPIVCRLGGIHRTVERGRTLKITTAEVGCGPPCGVRKDLGGLQPPQLLVYQLHASAPVTVLVIDLLPG